MGSPLLFVSCQQPWEIKFCKFIIRTLTERLPMQQFFFHVIT